MHDGTVRDCCFLEEGGTGAPLLISGGAGDCKVSSGLIQTGTVWDSCCLEEGGTGAPILV
jgi:hypothetical protein